MPKLALVLFSKVNARHLVRGELAFRYLNSNLVSIVTSINPGTATQTSESGSLGAVAIVSQGVLSALSALGLVALSTVFAFLL